MFCSAPWSGPLFDGLRFGASGTQHGPVRAPFLSRSYAVQIHPAKQHAVGVASGLNIFSLEKLPPFLAGCFLVWWLGGYWGCQCRGEDSLVCSPGASGVVDHRLCL